MAILELPRRAAGALRRQLRVTDLLETHRTEVLHLELTSKCNLRCTFCAVSQPTYQGRHLESECVDRIIDDIIERHPQVVTVNGHGETTVYRDWHRYCDRLLEGGISLHIISNFGRPFSGEELATLSRFKDIEISCDSHEPETFALLRRGAELPTLLANIERLRAVASADGRQPPPLSFSCVVSDVNVLGMPDYAEFVRRLGVSFVNFCNLTKYPDLPGAVNPSHVTTMAPADLPRAQTALEEAFRRLDRAGIAYRYQEGLLDTLRERVGELATPSPRQPPAEFAPPPAGSIPEPEPVPAEPDAKPAAEPEDENEDEAPQAAPVKRYATAGRQGMTRNCLDPWKFLLVQANREVMPCCWHRPIHSLGSSQSLAEVFNNTAMKRLRLGLLTGETPADCRTCPTRGWTPVADLRQQVWSYINDDLPYLGIPWAMRIVPERLAPLAIEYGAGWHPPEHDPEAARPEDRSWRWTGRRAECRLQASAGEGVLILRLRVNRELCPGQEIRLTLNGQPLDRFVPVQATSRREYALGPEQPPDESGGLSLVIATDRTFKPSTATPPSDDDRDLGVQVFEFLGAERG